MHQVSSQSILRANIRGVYHYHSPFHRLKGLDNLFRVMRPATPKVRIDSLSESPSFLSESLHITMTNPGNILKSRDITLPTKVHLVKAVVFPVVMYGCELDYKER